MVFMMLIALAEMATAGVQAPKPWTALRVDPVQVAPAPRAVGSSQEIEPLRNPRNGVTCTMRILKAEPIDSKAVLPAPESSVAPDMRGRGVSPCVD